ncbi:MAG: radical SAM protein [Nanoarchaeota archaeon]|nr:radical SAM protein [Nanoarchaeota archaeon]
MKVQLIRPPFDKGYNVEQFEDNISFPVGLLLLANTIKQRMPGVEVEVIDGLNQPIERTLAQVGNTDFVGATSFFSNYGQALRILEHAKKKGATTIIGGPNITHLGKRIITNRSFVDYAVVNDGEDVLPEIVLGTAGRNTPNLVYRNEDGKVVESSVRRNAQLITLFDLESLTDRENLQPQSVPVSGIRGCMKAEKESICDFCSIDHKLKVMNPKNMWEQVRILKSYGFDYIWEVGETAYSGYLKALFKTRPEDLTDTNWKFLICADLVDNHVVKTLKALGTKEVVIGIETPNDDVLRNVGKKATFADIKRAIKLLTDEGINIHANILYGLTGETYESANATFEYIKYLAGDNPHITKILASHAIPFFGTGMFRRLAGNAVAAGEYSGDLSKDDIFDYNALTRIYTKYFTSVDFDEMERLVRQTRALMIGRGYGTSFDVNYIRGLKK